MSKVSSGSYDRFPFRIILQVIVLSATAWFIGKVIVRNWTELQSFEFHIRIFPAMLSAVFFAVSLFFDCAAWRFILQSLRIDAPYRLVQYGFFISNLFNYIPGRVVGISGRAYLYGPQNHFKGRIVAACFLEMAVFSSVGSLVALCLMVYLNKWSTYRVPLILLFLLSCLLASSTFFDKSFNFCLAVFKKQSVNLKIGRSHRMVFSTLYLAHLLCQSVAVYFMVTALVPTVTPGNAVYIYLCWLLSDLMGHLVFFIPKGIGVRESFLVQSLSPLITPPLAVIFSLFSRAWFTLTELVVAATIFFFFKPEKNAALEHDRTEERGT